MKAIRMGIVGSGGMAGARADHFLETEDSSVVAVAARNPETGSALAARCEAKLYPDWKDMLTQAPLDAVFVATHNALHGEIALAALEQGIAVLSEYPACRHPSEAGALMRRLEEDDAPLLAFTHREHLSRSHRALRRQAARLGAPLCYRFSRVTPGRGKRPEVLFNLELSGPPALFFVYHIHPAVDLFGRWERVSSEGHYVGLGPDGGYEQFANDLTVRFANGALGHWSWAGGVTVAEPEESRQLLFEKGSLRRGPGGWMAHPPLAPEEAASLNKEDPDLEEAISRRFVELVRAPETADWRSEARKAIEAAALGLAAEISQKEGRAVTREEILPDTAQQS